MVDSRAYYSVYNGHDPEHLQTVHDELRRGGRSAIFLAGDSSLDNKFWFSDTAAACNGYERVLRPPVQKQDVCYWLNREAARRGRSDLFCLNSAIEATSLNDRACSLLAQDRFIREHITPDDTLVVSVGGNDLALEPLLATVLNIIPLLCLTPTACVRHGQACPPNTHVDCGCLGCGVPGCAVSLFGFPFGLAYFVDLFKNRVENYVRRLVGRRRPRKVHTEFPTTRHLHNYPSRSCLPQTHPSRRKYVPQASPPRPRQPDLPLHVPPGGGVHDLLPGRARARLLGGLLPAGHVLRLRAGAAAGGDQARLRAGDPPDLHRGHRGGRLPALRGE